MTGLPDERCGCTAAGVAETFPSLSGVHGSLLQGVNHHAGYEAAKIPRGAMLACVDVDYRKSEAVAACVLFHAWPDAASAGEHVTRVGPVAPYEPGQFYRRELPCLLAVLESVEGPLEAVVVDGYVWLRNADAPGLGAHLYDALGKRVPVVGVAKFQFRSAALAVPVKRGSGRRPLYVSAAGMSADEAARQVQAMHGAFRVPTLL